MLKAGRGNPKIIRAYQVAVSLESVPYAGVELKRVGGYGLDVKLSQYLQTLFRVGIKPYEKFRCRNEAQF